MHLPLQWPAEGSRRLVLVGVLASTALTLLGCPSTPCKVASDCKSEDVCLAGTCSPPNVGKVLPDGGYAALQCEASPTLVAGALAGSSSDPGACLIPRGTAVAPSQHIQSLGSFKTGSQVSFNVPTDTYSFSIVTQAITATGPIAYQGLTIENTVFPDLLTAPGGVKYFDSNDEVPNDGSSLKIFFPLSPSQPITGAMTVPNTTAALTQTGQQKGYPSGTWKFGLTDLAFLCTLTNGCTGGSDAGVYDVTVITHTGIPPARGTFDLDIYLVADNGLTRDNAPNDSSVARMIHTLASMYASTGTCLGKVTFFDVPQWAKDRFGSGVSADEEGPCSELSQMYTLSVPGRSAISVFLVENLSTSGQQLVLGKDGTIPGPGPVSGTIASGTVVSAVDLKAGTCPATKSFSSCGADRVAYIAAHEVGHFLGLFHVSEASGTFFDPLSDTLRCECQSCVGSVRRPLCADSDPPPSQPTLVSSADCNVSGPTTSCGGGDNLMFWSFDGNRAVGNLTAQQGAIMRANPVLQ